MKCKYTLLIWKKSEKVILNKVDQIVMMKEGVVANIGKHDELIGKNGELKIMMEKTDWV